jgi:hypothetical protein
MSTAPPSQLCSRVSLKRITSHSSIVAEETEMPHSRSKAIQSERTRRPSRCLLRLLV